MEITNMHQFMTTRQALSTKNPSTIRFMEETKGKKIDVKKHIKNILKTNDINIITMFIKNTLIYKNEIFDNTDIILKSLTPKIVYYVIGNNISNYIKERVLTWSRIDVIKYYLSNGLDIFANYCISAINEEPSCVRKKDMIFDFINFGDIELINYILDNLNNKLLQNLFIEIRKCDYSYDIFKEDVVVFLYNKGYYLYSDMYTYGVCKNIISLLNPLPKEPSSRNLELDVYNARNGIFDNNSNIIEKLSSFQLSKILYYAIIHNNNYIYNKYSSLENKYFSYEDALIVCSVNVDKCLYDSICVLTTFDCTTFLEIYSDTIIFQKNDTIVNFMISRYRCSINVLINFIKNGINIDIQNLINNDLVMFNNLKKDNLYFILGSNNEPLINIIVAKKMITLKRLVRYCCVSTILKYLHIFNEDISKKVCNNIVRYGNLEIVKYCTEHGKVDKKSLYEAFLNCTKAAEYLLEHTYYFSNDLSDFIVDKYMFPDYELNNLEQYYEIITKKCPSTKNLKIDRFIESDNVMFFKYMMNYEEITKFHIYQMIYHKSFRIMKYVASIGQLEIPFCQYTFHDNNSPTLTIKMDMNDNCSCSCLANLNYIHSTQKNNLKIFLEIYLDNIEKLRFNKSRNLVICTRNTRPICSIDIITYNYMNKSYSQFKIPYFK